MYIPASFAETNQSTLHDFIDRHSFGVLVNQGERAPDASHIPFLLNRNEGPRGQLTGHVARANPQWKSLEDSQVLVIFSGPHTYVSPAWYEAKNVVPIWNYVAVHVYGRVDSSLTRTGCWTSCVIQSTSMKRIARTWSLDDPDDDFVHGLLNAIVGFDIDIERLEGKWKLNQNHDEQRRQKVVDNPRASGSPADAAIADLMSRP